MPKPDEKDICPLCSEGGPFFEAQVPTAPIVTYWRAVGYDVEAAFPELPAYLTKQRCPHCDLRFFLPRLIGGADLYAALQRTENYYGATKWEFTEVLRLLANATRTQNLLEFGCGRGMFLNQARPYVGRSLGIDFNEDALAECRRKGLDTSSADLSKINDRFDVVLSFQVMEHLPNPGEVFDQLVGLTRAGGLIIVAVPNEDGPLGELQEYYLNLPPHHFSRWTERTLRFLGDTHGLRLEQHICEPLSEILYLTLVNERFRRNLTESGFLARFAGALSRRIAIAQGLAQLDVARERLKGQSQIAIYRKPASAAA